MLKNSPKLTALTLIALLAGCSEGGGGTTTGGGTPTPTDSVNPTVTFSETSLSIISGATAAVTLTATDNVGVTTGPTVSCTNGGSFANDVFTAPTTTTNVTSVCTATASDAAGNTGNATLTVSVTGTSGAVPNVDLTSLFNYENQPVPAYINATSGVWKDTASLNPITDEAATLGRVLFYDKALSTNNQISCGSCHQQANAFSDLAEQSQGVNGTTTRHSMRLINLRWREETAFRWDGSAPTLEDQMIIPIKAVTEMGYSGTNGAPDFDDLIAELEMLGYYDELFTLAFGDATITEARIANALADFVRSIQSFDSKYDTGRATAADDLADFANFTAAENAGKRLFIEDFTFTTDVIDVNGEMFNASRRTSGGLNCGTCHRPPEFDIDPASLNNGFIRSVVVGIPFDFSVTKSPTMRDLMKTNGDLNGGMFHAGQADNLIGITAHYDFRQIEPSNNNLDPRMTPGGLPQWLDITATEQQQLFAFMETLSGTDVYTNEKWSDPFE